MTINLSRQIPKFNRNAYVPNMNVRVNMSIIYYMYKVIVKKVGGNIVKSTYESDFEKILGIGMTTFRSLRDGKKKDTITTTYTSLLPDMDKLVEGKEILNIEISDKEWRAYFNFYDDWSAFNKGNYPNKEDVKKNAKKHKEDFQRKILEQIEHKKFDDRTAQIYNILEYNLLNEESLVEDAERWIRVLEEINSDKLIKLYNDCNSGNGSRKDIYTKLQSLLHKKSSLVISVKTVEEGKIK